MDKCPEDDFFKKLQLFCRERDNADRCAPFEKLRLKYESLWEKYAFSFDDLSQSVAGGASERRYSFGGMSMHRGFYSPSCLDMVDGRIKRGKLLKVSPRLKRYNYEYLFDRFGRMICVHCFGRRNKERGLLSSEVIELTADGTRGFVFDRYAGNRLLRISECRYSDDSEDLLRYESAIFSSVGCIEISVEIPHYENGLLTGFLWYRYYPKFLLADRVKYIFSRDSNGELDAFISEKYSGLKKIITSPMPVCNKT